MLAEIKLMYDVYDVSLCTYMYVWCESRKSETPFRLTKLDWCTYQIVEKYDDVYVLYNYFGTRQTDRQTASISTSVSRVSMSTSEETGRTTIQSGYVYGRRSITDSQAYEPTYNGRHSSTHSTCFFISQVKKLLLVSSAARWPDCCRRRLCSIHWRCSVRILAKSDPHHPQICTDAELEPVPKRRSLTRRPYRTDPDVECLETQIKRGIVY